MAKILTLSGWGQAADSLHTLFPDAECLDYLSLPSLSEVEAACLGTSYDMLIGWSLGGAIASYLLANRFISANRLVLLATAYQFPQDTVFDEFKAGLAVNEEKTLKRFQMLIAKGHSNSREVMRKMDLHVEKKHLAYWLNQLVTLSVGQMDAASFPETLLIHGCEDYIIPISNFERFQHHIPNCRSLRVNHCGHAPHLEEPLLIQNEINNMMRHDR
ncbi:MAG: alpha/beta hydrolase [Rickettsiales bacterium]|nr:alpha/beta hydrolase [Rickettsiales bacterium]